MNNNDFFLILRLFLAVLVDFGKAWEMHDRINKKDAILSDVAPRDHK